MLKAHKGQTDKAGSDYRMHPIRVAQRCIGDVAKVVALLHDVLEDTCVSVEDLREMGFGEDIINGVLGVTRRENETYEEFIERAGKNPISLEVKIADLRDNLDVTRLPEVTEKELPRINKYLRSLRYLESVVSGEYRTS